MPRTFAIARLWYEGSSFTPVPTRLTRFHEREWSEGDAAVAFYRGTRTELGAAVDFLETQTDANRWRGRWLRCCAASPGGPVVEEDLQGIIAGIVRGIEEAAADAVYLSLHGALLGEVGASFLVKLGGRLTPIYGKPVELDVSVERLTDGRYRNRGPMEAGLLVNLGRTAVLRHGELRNDRGCGHAGTGDGGPVGAAVSESPAGALRRDRNEGTYSSLIPASRTTLPHLSSWARRNRSSSAGAIGLAS